MKITIHVFEKFEYFLKFDLNFILSISKTQRNKILDRHFALQMGYKTKALYPCFALLREHLLGEIQVRRFKINH